MLPPPTPLRSKTLSSEVLNDEVPVTPLPMVLSISHNRCDLKVQCVNVIGTQTPDSPNHHTSVFTCMQLHLRLLLEQH
jgi:hypothetical protein